MPLVMVRDEAIREASVHMGCRDSKIDAPFMQTVKSAAVIADYMPWTLGGVDANHAWVSSVVHSVQDHGTKWNDNRALTNRSATSIAIQLVDIFTQIGTPCISQCGDNGTEFKGIAGKKASLKDSDVVDYQVHQGYVAGLHA
ncbi:MAG: hypothetical protein SGPRY_014058, partial [Prymnesium sp.]